MGVAGELKKVADASLRGGTRVLAQGVEFALYSQHATSVVLCLFDAAGREEAGHYRLHRHDDGIWRGFLPKAKAGLRYGYRVSGAFDPDRGHRFNANKLLVDPFARALTGPVINNAALFTYQVEEARADDSFSTSDSAPYVPKGIVVADGSGAAPGERLHTPLADTVLYELHVGGFTRRHPGIDEGLRGTFSALTSPPLLQHMRDLGITAVELLPIHAFNDEPHLWRNGLTNYWGYNSYNFFAPDPRYGSAETFREMVRRFHAAGIEVILDVVYNHSGEGDEHGPTLSFRGIDNASYYRLMPGHPRLYINDTGCGNTLDLEHPYVREMVLRSLRYWANEMEVDGFRFDLAPVLARTAHGFTTEAAFFRDVEADPELSALKLIAEPWDVGLGGYKLGEFPLRWSEWNDKYRDSVRAYWRGDDSIIGALADHITGSRRLFRHHGRRPQATVNFVAVHDGFTLEDVVSYDHKHNDANHEGNRDGHNNNLSRNWGEEGPTTDPARNRLRQQQKRNMLATLFLSQGVPMLQAGDEFGRTQRGNNNNYCQDNELSWIDWQAPDRQLTRFVSRLSALRRAFPQLRRHGFLTGGALLKGETADIAWFSPEGRRMKPHDWELHYARCFGFYLSACEPPKGQAVAPLLVLMNAHHAAIEFRMPRPLYAEAWNCLLDTSEEHEGRSGIAAGEVVSVPGHCLMVLSGIENAAVLEAEAAAERYGPLDLCRVAGIEEVYEDLSGTRHRLSDDSARQFLALFGYDVSSDAAIDRQVRESLKSEWDELIPPVTVLRLDADAAGQAVPYRGECRLHVPEKLMHGALHWSIALESGEVRAAQVRIEHLPLLRSAKVGRRPYHELLLPLPPGLPLGYHQLTLRIGTREAASQLIVAPQHCYRPQWMREHKHVFGIAHQLYSLTRQPDTGIGDLTDLVRLVTHAGQAGADAVGLNPLHALFPLRPDHASPYAPSSRLWLNTLFLDVVQMDGYDRLSRTAAAGALAMEAGELVDYAAVAKRKYPLFREVYKLFRSKGGAQRKAEFDRFRAERGESLRVFSRFCALDQHFAGAVPRNWPTPYQDPASAEVEAFAARNEEEVSFHAFLQWQADEQLKKAADACRQQGMQVGLYGDLAVGVAADGADAWANPDIFLRSVSFGAPPDAFNSDGQNWCMPPMNPRLLTRAAYRPFIEMLRENMRHYGALRMDHVMWLQRMFIIPEGQSAANGTYLRFPFEDLLAILALESTRARCLVIGEDLGTVPLGFRERMEIEAILSYKLMRFERHYDGSFKTPNEYPYLALATPSSHDLPTLFGFFTGLDIEVKQQIGMIKTEQELAGARYIRRDKCLALVASLQRAGVLERDAEWMHDERSERLERIVDAVQVYLARSRAALMMLNLEDLARSVHQVNVPGTVDEVPNWRRRLDFDPAKLSTDEALLHLFRLVSEARRAAKD